MSMVNAEEQHIEDRDRLLENLAKLVEHTLEAMKKWHICRDGLLDGRPVLDVIRERLALLPEPERVALCAYIIGETSGGEDFRLAAVGTWIHMLGRVTGTNGCNTP